MADLAFFVGFSLMLLGIVGIFVPMLPGVPLMFIGALLYSWLTGFDVLTWPWLVLMGLITLASLVVNFGASVYMTHKLGGSRWASAGTIVGIFAGIFFLGAYGALIGGFGGAVLAEVFQRKPWRRALKAGSGSFLGFIIGLISDSLAALLIMTIFLYHAL